MIDKTKVAIRASTQDHLDIEDVIDDIVILKNGGACLVIATTAINFGLLSEKEQDATIYAYAGLLNSLTFPLQIVIRSQKKDISEYLQLLDNAALKEKKELIKNQILKYRKFIQETVQKNNVLDKKFFLIIPMNALELGIKKASSFDKNYLLEQAKVKLYPKRDHLLRLLNRLGLQGRQLNTQELIRLFFNIYNQESPGQPILETKQYQRPLVQAAPEKLVVTTKPETKPIAKETNLQSQIDGLVKNSVK